MASPGPLGADEGLRAVGAIIRRFLRRIRRGVPYVILAGAGIYLFQDILRDPGGGLFCGGFVADLYTWHYWRLARALQGLDGLMHTTLIMYPAGVFVYPISPLLEAAALGLQIRLSPEASFNALAALMPVLTSWAPRCT